MVERYDKDILNGTIVTLMMKMKMKMMKMNGFIEFIKKLYQPPKINPKNGKALSIPLLNPWNKYGRAFNFAWLGFFVSFLSWFAFPPLLSHSIKKDLNLTSIDIANNNIAGLCATLLARVALGPIVDKIGPRYSMILVLIIGSIPTAMIPLVKNVSGLHAIRFFIGLLGGSFIPCQLWTISFFDKSIIGLANSLVGGWGNSGAGVAFFIMPALVNDLAEKGYNIHDQWTYSFLIGPLIILLCVAILMFIFGDDCPEGCWSKRSDVLKIGVDVRKIDIVSISSNHPVLSHQKSQIQEVLPSSQSSPSSLQQQDKIDDFLNKDDYSFDINLKNNLIHEDSSSNIDIIKTKIEQVVNLDEIVEDPSFSKFIKTIFNYKTLLVALPYFTTFGGELAIESILSSLYLQRSQYEWSESYAGAWGSMLGLLNVITRPIGGLISDILYSIFKTTKIKKKWLLFCGLIEGIFLLWIGLIPVSKLNIHGLIGSLSIMCIFMEAGNGANFSLVPHINKQNTGIVAGFTGAMGNFGGIIFSLIFRYNINKDGINDYMKSFWIIGIIIILINIACVFIPVREDRPDEIIMDAGVGEMNEKQVV